MDVRAIFYGSDASRTKKLYAELYGFGAAGLVASHLLRACKASDRAKKYRGGIYRSDGGRSSFRDLAYQTKQRAMHNLCVALVHHPELGFRWGWKLDPHQPYHSWVLYVDLPSGQVSFHTDKRLQGPDYPADWDQIRGVSSERIIEFTKSVLASAPTLSGGL